MKDAAKSGQTKTSSVVNQEVASKVPAATQGANLKEPSMRRVVQRERRKHMPKAPTSISEIDLSGQWSLTYNGERWVIMKVGKYSYLQQMRIYQIFHHVKSDMQMAHLIAKLLFFKKSSKSRQEFEDIMINIKEENKRQFEEEKNLRRKTDHILTVCRKLLKKVFTQQLGKCGQPS